jgi:hypothetical protein
LVKWILDWLCAFKDQGSGLKNVERERDGWMMMGNCLWCPWHGDEWVALHDMGGSWIWKLVD